MSPSADKVPTQRLGIKKPTNTRPMVVPAIPLPLVEKQQQQKQQRQQRQQRQQKRQEELERQERQEQQEQKERQERQELSNQHKKQIQSALQDQKPEDESCTPASTPTTQLSHSVLSPSQHSNGNKIASPVPLPTPRASKPTGGKHRDAGQVAPSKPPIQNGSLISRSPAGHSLQRSDRAHRQDMNENETASCHHGSLPVRPDSGFQQPSVHRALPSNGSITFGAFQESEDNSLPPSHDAHAGNPPPALIGFHPPVYVPYNPPGPGMVDWPGPPRIALSGDLNGYTPTSGFNPSTPGSFRGSQSPDNVNANGVSGGSHASNNGPFPLPDLVPHNGTHPTLLSPPPPPPSVYGFPGIGHVKEDIHPREDVHRLGLDFVHFLERRQHQNFHDAQSADCYIFLHFPRDKTELKGGLGNTMERGVSSDGLALANAPPQLFMGHRATLAQSYTISQMLLGSGNATVQTGSFGFPVLILHISLDDPYISVDASMQALRSMYGYAINDVSAIAAQSRVQAMDMAISNMAAGFLFMLNSVEFAGMEQAFQLLGWDTIERVLAFCLNGALLPNAPTVAHDMFGLPYPQAEYSYGRGGGQNIRRLLHKALNFIVWNFPTDFIMQENSEPADASPISLSRFPCMSPKQLSAERHHTSDASSARDGIRDAQQRNPQDKFEAPSSGSVSLPSRTTNSGLKRSPQPSTIMFGDFPPVDGNTALVSPPPVVANGTHKPTSVLVSEANSTAATLSRVLVGVPFGFVNYILEHPDLSRGCSDRSLSLALDARRAIARNLVIERESRREQTVRKFHDVKSVDLDGILARIRNPSPTLPQDYSMDGWDALGWREECHNEGPGLVRVWTHSRQAE